MLFGLKGRAGDGGKSFKFAQNAMEASILCDLNFICEHGFSTTKSGGEHVFGGWLDRLKKEDQLTIEDVTPSYAYVWGDGLSKTSGNIDHPDNFVFRCLPAAMVALEA